jgi:hypothetical protein
MLAAGTAHFGNLDHNEALIQLKLGGALRAGDDHQATH